MKLILVCVLKLFFGGGQDLNLFESKLKKKKKEKLMVLRGKLLWPRLKHSTSLEIRHLCFCFPHSFAMSYTERDSSWGRSGGKGRRGLTTYEGLHKSVPFVPSRNCRLFFSERR